MIHTGEWPLSPAAAAVLRLTAARAVARGSDWAGVEDLAAVLRADEQGQVVVDEDAIAVVRANKRLEKVIERAADGWGISGEGLKNALEAMA